MMIATSGGPRLVALAIAAAAALQFFRWAVEFVCRRMDARADRLDQRERSIELRFDSRLKHLELEVEQFREATMLLFGVLAEQDPANPALRDVAKILRKAWPATASSPTGDMAELLAKIDAADRGGKA